MFQYSVVWISNTVLWYVSSNMNLCVYLMYTGKYNRYSII